MAPEAQTAAMSGLNSVNQRVFEAAKACLAERPHDGPFITDEDVHAKLADPQVREEETRSSLVELGDHHLNVKPRKDSDGRLVKVEVHGVHAP